jgi:hypothetical protein
MIGGRGAAACKRALILVFCSICSNRLFTFGAANVRTDGGLGRYDTGGRVGADSCGASSYPFGKEVSQARCAIELHTGSTLAPERLTREKRCFVRWR